MTQYTSVTDSDLAAMLAAIGVSSVAEIFDRQIPRGRASREPADLPAGKSEQEVYEHLRELAASNVSAEEELCFLGAGMYDHYVPAIVDMLMERSEFLTPYTPYQPEISQGGLQVMFEYQTAICELTGLPVSNASVYEGPSAVASAGYLAKLHNGRKRFVVSAGLHPHTLATLRTYAHGYAIEVVEVPTIAADGVTDIKRGPRRSTATPARRSSPSPTSTAPSRTPQLCPLPPRPPAARSSSRSPRWTRVMLSILAPPGDCGVDVAVGEGQSLGNRLDFGGPSFGFFAAHEDYLRRMPGRIAGETTDADGRRGFVLTLQTREQHIRREKATSNICTSQALNALAGVVYLSWLGRGVCGIGRTVAQAHPLCARGRFAS